MRFHAGVVEARQRALSALAEMAHSPDILGREHDMWPKTRRYTPSDMPVKAAAIHGETPSKHPPRQGASLHACKSKHPTFESTRIFEIL
jgi:hypothetical protein